jgi:hypothetical protein
MLVQSCIPALIFTYGAVASSHKYAQPSDPYRHVLRSGREYSTPQRRFPAVSRQVNNDVAMMTGRENNNNTMIMGQEISKDTIIPTIQQADSDAANSAAEPSPRRRQFSTYLFMESPEGCPSLQLECKDCGGHKLLGHRDEVAPSVRCSGVRLSFLHLPKFGCTNDVSSSWTKTWSGRTVTVGLTKITNYLWH